MKTDSKKDKKADKKTDKKTETGSGKKAGTKMGGKTDKAAAKRADKKVTKKTARKNQSVNAGSKSSVNNRPIQLVTYLFIGLFACLIMYIGYFLLVDRENVINNAYNARLDQFADRIVRGSIMSSDGAVLAETQVDENGGESRYYPYGSRFSHVLGYATKGKAGLESMYNYYLLSSHINPLERAFNEIREVKSPGDTVYTTLNLTLQQTAYDALGDRSGAVIAMEPDTGKILAMVSKPDFDPNQIDSLWEELTDEESTDSRLLNRASQGLYPPGSTFKILTALQFIREHPDNYDAYRFSCTGRFDFEEYTISCYHKEAHGDLDLRGAFANSCNGAFANLGLTLDWGNFRQTCDSFLFNSPLPVSFAYNKSRFSMEAGAKTWDMLQTSIGQGVTQMSPLHLAMITSAVANGGSMMKPYVVDRIENAKGGQVKRFTPSLAATPMTAKESAVLTDLMTAVVKEGTGSALRDAGYQAAGKTGSAEFDRNKETHAWFTGFAPVEDPKIVVCVVVEEGGSGGKAAAPIARKVMDAYLK